jgi:hypothetical protein
MWYISVYVKIKFDSTNKDGGKTSKEYETYFILIYFSSFSFKQ